ncbi:hypothetical protein [Streptomyces sannanensis]
MNALAITLTDAESAALADLADAQGRTTDGVAQEAVRRYLRVEAAMVRAAAMRLALHHAPLLRRLGE